MQAKENLRLALIAAFDADKVETDTAAAAGALTDVLCAFAAVIAGPAPTVVGIELASDDTKALILAELRGLRADLDRLTAGGEAMRTLVG